MGKGFGAGYIVQFSWVSCPWFSSSPSWETKLKSQKILHQLLKWSMCVCVCKTGKAKINCVFPNQRHTNWVGFYSCFCVLRALPTHCFTLHSFPLCVHVHIRRRTEEFIRVLLLLVLLRKVALVAWCLLPFLFSQRKRNGEGFRRKESGWRKQRENLTPLLSTEQNKIAKKEASWFQIRFSFCGPLGLAKLPLFLVMLK